MLNTLVILYLVNGFSFVVADNLAYSEFRIMGPPYVRNPNPVNIFLAILIAPLATIYFSVSRAGRGGGSRLQLIFMALSYGIAFFYQTIWLHIGGGICLFLVRRFSAIPDKFK